MLELDGASVRVIPLWQKIFILDEKLKRRGKEQLWREYIGSLVTAFGGKPFSDVAQDYERALQPAHDKEKEIESAYSVAEKTLKALERSRKG